MPRYHTDLEKGREEDKVGRGEGDMLERGREREEEERREEWGYRKMFTSRKGKDKTTYRVSN